MSVPLNGRKAQAAVNDQLIPDAARAVFVADPGAPISAVAKRAGVGIGAIYHRFSGKEELLRWLCGNGLDRYIASAETALASAQPQWESFQRFLTDVVEADTHSLTLRLAGTFTPTDDLFTKAARAQELTVRVIEQTKSAGAIRADFEVDDLAFLFEQLAAIRLGDESRTAQLRQRYLTLLLDALRAPEPTPLPGPAPTWEEIGARWTRRR